MLSYKDLNKDFNTIPEEFRKYIIIPNELADSDLYRSKDNLNKIGDKSKNIDMNDMILIALFFFCYSK